MSGSETLLRLDKGNNFAFVDKQEFLAVDLTKFVPRHAHVVVAHLRIVVTNVKCCNSLPLLQW
jgi:hypothetical protein